MALILHHSLGSSLPLLPTSSTSFPPFHTRVCPSSKPLRPQFRSYSASASASGTSPMHQNDQLGTKFIEFPYVSAARRELMINLISTVENHLGSQLLPCSLPSDVQYFENQDGTAQASIQIRPGHESSLIDFILASWIHCDLPTGTSLNITSISAYLNSATDAPNFLIELIQNSPKSLVLILDLPHRKDLVLHPDYLHTFYEETHLDSHRQSLLKLPEAKPYISPSLFIRCAFSPTAALLRIDAEEEQRLEEIVRDQVGVAAKQVLGLWLDRCVSSGKREIGESEKSELEKRDNCFRRKTIEVDLGSSFPRMFGEEVANRVLIALSEAFGL